MRERERGREGEREREGGKEGGREGGGWERERKNILTFLYRTMLKKVGMRRKKYIRKSQYCCFRNDF